MIKEQVIEGFVEELSSKKPVPGGGGASAMAGALGTALGLMVGNLTVGKKRYAAVEAEVYERMTELTELQKEMLLLARRGRQGVCSIGSGLQSAIWYGRGKSP